MVVASKVGGSLKLAVIGLLTVAALCQGAVHFVTVAGLGGEPDYEQRFTSLAKEVEARKPGLFKLLDASRAGSSAIVIAGFAAQAERLSLRQG